MICRVPNNDVHVYLNDDQIKMLLESVRVRAIAIPMANAKNKKRKVIAERLVTLIENAKTIVIKVDIDEEYDGSARVE